MIGVCMRWLGGRIHPPRDEIVKWGSFTRVVIDPSIGMLPVSCEQLLSLAGLFFCQIFLTRYGDDLRWKRLSEVEGEFSNSSNFFQFFFSNFYLVIFFLPCNFFDKGSLTWLVIVFDRRRPQGATRVLILISWC